MRRRWFRLEGQCHLGKRWLSKRIHPKNAVWEISGQFYNNQTAEVTPNGSLVREFPQNGLKSGGHLPCGHLLLSHPASRTRHRPLCVRSSPLWLGTGTQTKGNGLKSGGASCHRSFQLPNRTQLCRGEGVQTREGLGQVRDGHDVITMTQAQIAARVAEFRAAEILYVPALIFEYLDAGRSQAFENLFQFSDLLYLAATVSTGLTGHAVSNDGSTMSGPLTAVLATIPPGSMSTKVDLLKHLEENGEILDALVRYAATYTAGATDALTAATGGPAAPSVAPSAVKSLAETRTLQLQTLKSAQTKRVGTAHAVEVRKQELAAKAKQVIVELHVAVHSAPRCMTLVGLSPWFGTGRVSADPNLFTLAPVYPLRRSFRAVLRLWQAARGLLRRRHWLHWQRNCQPSPRRSMRSTESRPLPSLTSGGLWENTASASLSSVCTFHCNPTKPAGLSILLQGTSHSITRQRHCTPSARSRGHHWNRRSWTHRRCKHWPRAGQGTPRTSRGCKTSPKLEGNRCCIEVGHQWRIGHCSGGKCPEALNLAVASKATFHRAWKWCLSFLRATGQCRTSPVALSCHWMCKMSVS